MADHTNTLVQCSLKIRHGRKWKTRWCEFTKLSPVSDQIVLKFYKGQDQLLSGKEIRREQIVITAQNFCGVESCIRHPKNPYVLTIICLDQIVLLSFACHTDLLDWYYKTYNTLGTAIKFKCRINIPNGSRLRAGPGFLYFHDNHFAITDDVPSQLIGGWSLANLSRYGLIDEGFAFEVSSTSKGGGAFVVLTQHAESLQSHFDAATYSCTSNRWSHVSSTVSIHEELVPKQKDFSEEMHHLLGISRNNDHQHPSNRTGSNGQGGIQMRHTYPSQARSAAMLEHCSNRRNQVLRNQDGPGSRNVEMIQMEQAWAVGSSSGYGGGSSSGSSVETIFNNCDSLRSPKKTTPIREQNYEVMASFNHLREVEDSSNGNEPHLAEVHEACAICQGSKKNHSDESEEHEYVNLPPPKNSKKLNQQGSVDGENLNASPTSAPSSETRKEQTENRAPKFSSNAAHARTMSLPLNEDYLLMKYNENESCRQSGSKTGKPRSLSIHPSLDHTNSLPPPFNNLLPVSTVHGVAHSEKSSSQKANQSDIPVPFQHGDLVKPVGPIAMLRLNSLSSSSSESILSSASESLLDVKSSRGASFSRPRQSSIGSSYQRAFAKMHSRSQDERSSSPSVDAHSLKFPSRSSDPDFQRMTGQKEDDNDAFVYVRKGSLERRPESPISSAPSVTSYITRRRQSLQRADSSIDESKARTLDDKQSINFPRRKRCNTDPSVVFTTSSDGTSWCRDPNDDDDTDGYLIMKPVYEEKLKRFESRQHSSSSASTQVMPQSPLHSGEKIPTIQSKLKRSATVSGEVSNLSPVRSNQRTMSLRERPTRHTSTSKPKDQPKKSFMDRFLRKRGGSEGTVQLDMARPRHKHNYASIDPENVVRQSRRGSLQAKMHSVDDTPAEVDILDDPEFSESLSKFITENPPQGEYASSVPCRMQFNQLEDRRSSLGRDTGINFTADVDTVVFTEDRRKLDSSDEYLDL